MPDESLVIYFPFHRWQKSRWWSLTPGTSSNTLRQKQNRFSSTRATAEWIAIKISLLKFTKSFFVLDYAYRDWISKRSGSRRSIWPKFQFHSKGHLLSIEQADVCELFCAPFTFSRPNNRRSNWWPNSASAKRSVCILIFGNCADDVCYCR